MEIQGLWIFFFTAHIVLLGIYKQIYLLCISQPECPIHLSVLHSPHSQSCITLYFIYCYADQVPVQHLSRLRAQSSEVMSFLVSMQQQDWD